MNQLLVDYGRELRWRWRWLAWGVLLAVGAATIALLVVPPTYQAHATVFVRSPGDVSRAVDGGDLYANHRAPSFAALVVDPDRFGGRVTAAARPGTVLIDVTATSSDAQEAQRLAADYLIAWADDVRSLETVPGSVVPRAELVVIDPPRVPTQQDAFGAPVAVLLAGAAFGGLVLAASAVVLRAIYDRKLRDRRDVERISALRTLGPIRTEQDARAVGRTALPRTGRVLLVTGTDDGPGLEATAAALAAGLSDPDDRCSVTTPEDLVAGADGRVVVACGSVLVSTAAERMAPHADAIVLVVPLAVTTDDRLRRACALLPMQPEASVVVVEPTGEVWRSDATTEEKADVP